LSIQSATGLTFTANGAAAVTGAAYTIVPAASYHFSSPILTAGGITTSNVMNIIDGMWLKLPAKLKGKADTRILVGWDTFESYIVALRNANLFHFTADRTNGELTIPGTQYTMVAVHGLDAQNRIFALRLANMAIGVDLENEEEKFE